MLKFNYWQVMSVEIFQKTGGKLFCYSAGLIK